MIGLSASLSRGRGRVGVVWIFWRGKTGVIVCVTALGCLRWSRARNTKKMAEEEVRRGLFIVCVLLALVLFFVYFAEQASGDVLALSRHDCFVIADKECDRLGWAAEVEYNHTSLRCEWMCRRPRWEVQVEEVRFWFMHIRILRRV